MRELRWIATLAAFASLTLTLFIGWSLVRPRTSPPRQLELVGPDGAALEWPLSCFNELSVLDGRTWWSTCSYDEEMGATRVRLDTLRGEALWPLPAELVRGQLVQRAGLLRREDGAYAVVWTRHARGEDVAEYWVGVMADDGWETSPVRLELPAPVVDPELSRDPRILDAFIGMTWRESRLEVLLTYLDDHASSSAAVRMYTVEAGRAPRSTDVTPPECRAGRARCRVQGAHARLPERAWRVFVRGDGVVTSAEDRARYAGKVLALGGGVEPELTDLPDDFCAPTMGACVDMLSAGMLRMSSLSPHTGLFMDPRGQVRELVVPDAPTQLERAPNLGSELIVRDGQLEPDFYWWTHDDDAPHIFAMPSAERADRLEGVGSLILEDHELPEYGGRETLLIPPGGTARVVSVDGYDSEKNLTSARSFRGGASGQGWWLLSPMGYYASLDSEFARRRVRRRRARRTPRREGRQALLVARRRGRARRAALPPSRVGARQAKEQEERGALA